MIVRFLNAHQYRGKRTDHPAHPASPRKTYYPGDIVDLPAEYFERHLESYKFAVIHNAAAAAAGAAVALMEDMTIEQLRKLVEKHHLEDEIEGSGQDGRALREDLVRTLDKHYKSVGRSVSDENDIPDDAALARLRVDELVTLCEAWNMDVHGTGRENKVLKVDLVEALSERREREDSAGGNGEGKKD